MDLKNPSVIVPSTGYWADWKGESEEFKYFKEMT